MDIFKSYPGGKGSDGVFQTIINRIPPHDIYIEPYAGSATIYRKMRRAKRSYLNDLDWEVFTQLCRLKNENKSLVLSDDCAMPALRRILKNHPGSDQTFFIYLDPPYPKSTRKDKRDLYPCEMTDKEHVELLSYLNQLRKDHRVNMMISSYAANNPIYVEGLADWFRHDFPGNTRHGKVIETIWTNYDMNHLKYLHDYRYLGKDYRERERINRRHRNLLKKLSGLPKIEQNALLFKIKQQFNFNQFSLFE